MFSRSLLASRTALAARSSSRRAFASSTGSGQPVTPSPKNEANANTPIIIAGVLGIVAAAALMGRDKVDEAAGGADQHKSALSDAITSSAPDAKKPVGK